MGKHGSGHRRGAYLMSSGSDTLLAVTGAPPSTAEENIVMATTERNIFILEDSWACQGATKQSGFFSSNAEWRDVQAVVDVVAVRCNS